MQGHEALRRLRIALAKSRQEHIDTIVRGAPHDEYMKRCGKVQQIDWTVNELQEILKLSGDED